VKEKENFELAAKVLFFGSLEESFSIESAKRLSKAENYTELLKSIHSLLKSRRKKAASFVNMAQGSFSFPPGVDLSYWREFKGHCQEDAFYVVLYKWIGDFTDEEITSALGITRGSLLSRYNLGLKTLGGFLVNRQTSLGL
jgi:hypothetical protein